MSDFLLLICGFIGGIILAVLVCFFYDFLFYILEDGIYSLEYQYDRLKKFLFKKNKIIIKKIKSCNPYNSRDNAIIVKTLSILKDKGYINIDKGCTLSDIFADVKHNWK